MFNLVLTVITFAFLAIGSYAALHADGGSLLLSFERMSDKATIVRLINDSQQIGAAQRFHLAVKGRQAENPEVLVQQGFLKAIPGAPGGTKGGWVLDEAGNAALLAFERGEDYDRFASRVCALAGEMGGSAALRVSGTRPSRKDLDAEGVLFGCGRSSAENKATPPDTWFIHGF